ncbi:MAG: CPBP family intramembrane glutamic endopeptidase [Gemmatimonadales bacterium]
MPLLLGLRWTLTTSTRALRRLVALVVEQLGPLLALRSPVELVLLAVAAGLAEEFLFRGVMQAGLARVLPEWGAVLVTGAAFGLAHFITPAYALLAGVAGVYLGGLFWLEGSLTAPIVAHAFYDIVALNYVARLSRSPVHRYEDSGR